MKSINVPLRENSYKIVIGHNILSHLGRRLRSLKIGKDAVIITNPRIHKNHGRALVKGLKKNGFTVKILEVPAGEQSKSAKVAVQLMEKIARYDVMKEVFIVAFGGGVIGDLAGFVAASYKRGVPYVQVPTTFLAQVDSAIGGKTAIDLKVGKNLVGAFYQPKIVWSDVAVLSTLEKRQMRNGLAEAVKYGIIRDKNFFTYITKHYQEILNADKKALFAAVLKCSQIKAAVVAADEKETKNIRTIFNFGHTVGHAIEAAGKYKVYHHGEAIALGMRVAADISCQLKMFSKGNAAALNKVLSDIGLPKQIRNLKIPEILRVMQHDKKFLSGKNRFVLPKQIGKVKIVEQIPPAIIKKAILNYF